MKFIKKLTFLSVLLCTLVTAFALNLKVNAADTAGKLAQGAAITSGNKYIIALEVDGSYYYLGNGSSSSAPACKSLAVSSNTVSTVPSDALWVFNAQSDGTYKVVSATNNTLYLRVTSATNNGIRVATADTNNTWTINTSGAYVSMSVNSIATDRFLSVYKNGANYQDFRYYKTSSGVHQIVLFEYGTTGSGSGGNTGGDSGNDEVSYNLELVTNISDLSSGDVVVIAAADADVALSTEQKTNNRGVAEIVKSNDGSQAATTANVQLLTLETGNSSGTYAFNTGSGYLYAASSTSNYLKTQESLTDNSSFKITLSDGVFSIVAQGTNTRNDLKYNSSSNLFACYAADNTQGNVALYKFVSNLSNLSAPSNVSVSEDGQITFDTTSSEEEFVEKYTATVKFGDVSYSQDVASGDTLNYNIKGNASVTVIALSGNKTKYLDSAASDAFTWNISADYPVVTIEEFISKPVNLYYYYQVTGQITSIVNTQFGNLYVADETGELYIYGVLPEYGAANGQFSTNEATKDITAGMTLTVCGPRSEYNGSVQMEKSIHISHSMDNPATAFEKMDTVASLYLNYTKDESSGNTTTVTTITPSELGYENEADVTSISSGTVQIAIEQGTHTSLSGKYYTSDSTLRVYKGNVVTITSSANIVKVVVNFKSGSYALISGNDFSVSGAVGTWLGSAKSVTLNGTGTSRITSIVVTTGEESIFDNINFADGDAKLRFGAQISAGMYNALVAQGATFGVAIIPTTTLGSGTLTVDTEGVFVRENMTPAAVDANGKEVDDASAVYYQFALVIQNINVANFGTEFTAVSYVCVDGTYYYMNAKTYSVKTIAQAYVDSGDASYAAHLDALKALANLE